MHLDAAQPSFIQAKYSGKEGTSLLCFRSTRWLGFSLASHQPEHPVRGTQLNPFGPWEQTEFWEIQYLNVPALLHTNSLEGEALVQIPVSPQVLSAFPYVAPPVQGCFFSFRGFPFGCFLPRGASSWPGPAGAVLGPAAFPSHSASVSVLSPPNPR